jgi:hypothetical protein
MRRSLSRPARDEEPATHTDGEGQRTGVFRRLISARSSSGDSGDNG